MGVFSKKMGLFLFEIVVAAFAGAAQFAQLRFHRRRVPVLGDFDQLVGFGAQSDCGFGGALRVRIHFRAHVGFDFVAFVRSCEIKLTHTGIGDRGNGVGGFDGVILVVLRGIDVLIKRVVFQFKIW